MSEYLSRLLEEGMATVHEWFSEINVKDMRLADRFDLYQSAAMPLQSAELLNEWNQQQTHIGYFDEGYEVSQLWKKNWETRRMNDVVSQIGDVRRSMEP